MNRLKDQVIDVVKTGVAVMPVPLKIFGVLVADWVLILSALVSITVLIEKAPTVFHVLKGFYSWIRKVKKD